MGLYEQELRRFFGGSNMIQNQKYTGRTMLGKLDDDLRVKLQFISTHISGQYDAIRAQIINRIEGQIDAEVFKLSDILGPNPTCKNGDIHIWDYNGESQWYGYRPNAAEAAEIQDRIEGYLSLYQSEDLGMSM